MDIANLVTPLILTFNEAENISRTLSKLCWAKQIIVIDSFSTDRTVAILKETPNVHIFQRIFDTHSRQWNYGLNLVETKWVLAMDADYLLDDKLIHELKALQLDGAEIDGYWGGFQYCIKGSPLRASILPARLVLFKKSKARYVQDGHTQLLVLDGLKGYLHCKIFHDDRKPFFRWWLAQKKYAALEAEKLFAEPFLNLNLQDKLRKSILFAPTIIFFYCWVYKGLVWDGWNGFVYCSQRFLAELALSFALTKKLVLSCWMDKNSR